MIYHSRDGATWYKIYVNITNGQLYDIIDSVYFKGFTYLLINFSFYSLTISGTQLGKIPYFNNYSESCDISTETALDNSITINCIKEISGFLTMVGSGGYAGVMDIPDTTTATQVTTATNANIMSISWHPSTMAGLVSMSGSPSRFGSCRFIDTDANDVAWRPPSGGGGSSDDWVPSGQYIDITYGQSADMYTAPADGWMYVECTTFNTNAYIIGKVIIDPEATVGIYGAGATTYSTNKDLFILFPVGANYAFKMFNS
ncbi:MAG: hypothetical protein LBE98_00625, partial [Puniceicoccales bacterium]|nr:hypothetical protein [Puniceicoccales bacterium]